jgi:quercetin 2,3-dioxygenase
MNSVLKVRKLGFQWETNDPFLFCVHHEDYYPKGNVSMEPVGSLEGRMIGQDFTIKDGWRMYHGTRVPGFPVHPHRGFETITIVRDGFVDHADSLGAAGRYGAGDVQWMTAGKGIQHAEMFPLLNIKSQNNLDLFQIWLNLPSERKFAEPAYKMFWNKSVPKIYLTDGNGKKTEITVIAGSYENTVPIEPPPDSWAADPINKVKIWIVNMQSGAHWILPPAEKGINRTLYFFEGTSIKANGYEIQHYYSAALNPEAEVKLENGPDEGKLLLLQGRPIGEPVMQYGPFVMNNEAEIRQAFADYRKTEFGGWPWNRNDPVHSREQGRFARYADGSMENGME